MIKSGYVKFFIQDRISYLASRSNSATEWTPTIQELEGILSRIRSILINAYGAVNVVVKWLRSNIATSGNGDYGTPFKTLTDAQNWAVSNNRRVILLWHNQDITTATFIVGNNTNLDRIYLLGGRWDGNQKCIANNKVVISYNTTGWISNIGFLGNVRYSMGSLHDTGGIFNWNNKISIHDPTYWDVMYSYITNYHYMGYSNFLSGLDNNARYYRTVCVIEAMPI